MNEAEWLQSTDLSEMLYWLAGEVSDSTLRLFACACCRRIWEVMDSDLHRRVVEYAERFARGPGQNIKWIGRGHYTNRRLSCAFKQVEEADGWVQLQQELEAEQAALTDNMIALRYDWWTPQGTAASTLHFRYDYPYYVARGAAAIRSAPHPYWLHESMPRLSDEDDAHWCERIDREMASLCDLLREVYGRPDLA